MIININLNDYRKQEYADSLTKEQRIKARHIMARQLSELLAMPTTENLYWIETKTDLVDLVHEVYLSALLKDRRGMPYPFKKMVKLACAVLHMPEPANCYSIVCNARNRKNIKQTSFFSRYCRLLYQEKESNPLRGMIRRMKSEE